LEPELNPIEGMKKGTVFFDLSTNSPGVVRKLHDAFAEERAGARCTG
jgi:3-hydroxyisobutyrate dehydrogenase-like beta-hydroxyacid dehydrogenase